jgi:hypothetical protein
MGKDIRVGCRRRGLQAKLTGPLADRQSRNGIDMNACAVDHREVRGSLIVGQHKISPAKQDRLNVVVVEQPTAGRIEDGSLSFGDDAGGRHRHIGLVYIKQGLSGRRDDFRRSHTAIEAAFHDRSVPSMPTG